MADRPPNPAIAAAMAEALHGDREAAKRFYQELFVGPLFVTERYQTVPIPDSAEYPTDLVHLLGVKAPDKTIVPFFTHPSFVVEWGGAPLTYKTMSAEAFFKAVPDEWWACLDPGQEVVKEFSPWEIGELRLGPGSVDEIVEDLFATEMVEVLETEPVEEAEGKGLKEALVEEARKEPAISTIRLLRERGRDIDDEDRSALLVGIGVRPDAAERLEGILENVRQVAAIQQIGDEAVKVYGGLDERDNVALKLFEGVEPLYLRAGEPKSTLLGRVKNVFKRHDRVRR